jgi:hypothetical protein
MLVRYSVALGTEEYDRAGLLEGAEPAPRPWKRDKTAVGYGQEQRQGRAAYKVGALVRFGEYLIR